MSEIKKLLVFIVILVAVIIWAKSPFQWEEKPKPLSKITDYTEINFQDALNAVLYSKVNGLSKEDRNTQTVYKQLIKSAYPEFYKTNADNNFALHSKVNDAIQLIENRTVFDNFTYTDKNEGFYSYNPVYLGAYNFNKNTLPFSLPYEVRLPFTQRSSDIDSHSKMLASTGGLIYEDFYSVYNIPNYMSLKIDQQTAEIITTKSKLSKNRVCMRFNYGVDSTKDGYLQLSLRNWEYEPNNLLCGLNTKKA